MLSYLSSRLLPQSYPFVYSNFQYGFEPAEIFNFKMSLLSAPPPPSRWNFWSTTKTSLLLGFFTFASRLLLPGATWYFWLFVSFSPGFSSLSCFLPISKRGLGSHFAKSSYLYSVPVQKRIRSLRCCGPLSIRGSILESRTLWVMHMNMHAFQHESTSANMPVHKSAYAHDCKNALHSKHVSYHVSM
jgi:hypothetical protein